MIKNKSNGSGPARRILWNGILNEEFIIQTCSVKRLSDVKELDLSGLGISDSHIDANLFDKLTSLETLCLAKNEITRLDEKLKLRETLIELDISNNHLVNVDWLFDYRALKSLNIEGNSFPFDDSYKVLFSLPQLEMMNDAKVDRSQIGETYTKGLKEEVFRYWQQTFSSKYSEAVNDNEGEKIIDEFFELAKARMKFGLSSMKGFRAWRIDALRKEIVNYIKDTTLIKANADTKVVAVKVTSKKKRHASTNKSASSPKRVALKNSKQYAPNLFLQCHSKSTSSADFETPIWGCAFEPDVTAADPSSTTTSLAATCGGDLVCFIQCKTGKIESKFQQNNEVFYCCSWTTLKFESCLSNVLACGGHQGCIYLIRPDKNVFYGKITAHNKPIHSLLFSTVSKTRLISSDSRGVIILHDIGVPSGPDYDFTCKKLMTFGGLPYATIKVTVPLPNTGSYLLASSECGLYCWDVDGAIIKHRTTDTSRKFERSCHLELPLKNVQNTCVDALVLMSPDYDVVATKSAGEGVIQIWKFSALISDIKKSTTSSSGKKKPRNSVKVEILCELDWATTIHCYLNICSVSNLIFAGDHCGSLWVYKINHKKYEDQMPLYIVPFPSCERPTGELLDQIGDNVIFNDIACSSDMNHVLVTTDKNIVGLYGLKTA